MSSNGKLSQAEQRAQLRLEPFLGHLVPLDVPGTSGLPDFQVVGGPAAGGALEVTEWLDLDRAKQRGPIGNQREWRIPTRWSWAVGLHKKAQVRKVLGDPRLEQALIVAESRGQRQLLRSTSPDDVCDLFDELHVDHVLGFVAKPDREGIVRATWGSSAGWGWDGLGVSQWLNREVLESDLVRSKVDKLVRSSCRPAHLYVGLDAQLPAGFGVTSALESAVSPGGDPLALPAVHLPSGLDTLWLWPNMPAPGLRVDADGSWEIVFEAEDAARQLWPTATGWVDSSDEAS